MIDKKCEDCESKDSLTIGTAVGCPFEKICESDDFAMFSPSEKENK